MAQVCRRLPYFANPTGRALSSTLQDLPLTPTFSRMADPIVVLTDRRAQLTPATAYAARLAPTLHAQLVLLPLESGGAPAAPESAGLALAQLAHLLPVKAISATPNEVASDAVAAALQHHHPQLLVMDRPTGAEAERAAATAKDMLRSTPYPLLLVPSEAGPGQTPPRRIVLAVDAETFKLGEAAGIVRQLLRATDGVLTVLYVTEPNTSVRGADAQLSVRTADLVPYPLTTSMLGWVSKNPADGILEAAAADHADLLVLIARRRSFWGSLFHQSVTADLMKRSPIPVLLLPTLAE